MTTKGMLHDVDEWVARGDEMGPATGRIAAPIGLQEVGA